MKIIYIKKIEKINESVKAKIEKKNPTHHKGLENHLYGIETEAELTQFLLTNEGKEILDYMNIEPSEIQKIVQGDELSNYTKSKKIDILIITNTRKIGISCKTSQVATVGVLEMHGNVFYQKCKEFLRRNHMNCMESNLSFFPFFDENGRTKSGVEKANKNRFNSFCENIEKDWKKFLQFCLQGEDVDEKVEFLFFYDKTYKYLYVSNIEDYISFIEKYGNLVTFNSRMTITSTSNKGDKEHPDRRIKFKMQNPIYIINKGIKKNKFVLSAYIL